MKSDLCLRTIKAVNRAINVRLRATYENVRVGDNRRQSLAQNADQERPARRQPPLGPRRNLGSNQDPLDPLKHTVRDGRIGSQHQTGLQSGPQTRHSVLGDDFSRSIEQSRGLDPMARGVKLLSCRDYGDGDRKDLGERAGESTEDQFKRGRELNDRFGGIAREALEGPVTKPAVEEEVCKL